MQPLIRLTSQLMVRPRDVAQLFAGPESASGPAGITQVRIRETVSTAVDLLRDDGDAQLQLLDGLDVIGPDDAGLPADRLHPDPVGYRLMADRVAPQLDRLGDPGRV